MKDDLICCDDCNPFSWKEGERWSESEYRYNMLHTEGFTKSFDRIVCRSCGKVIWTKRCKP